jgi:fimbrial chaperone protein
MSSPPPSLRPVISIASLAVILASFLLVRSADAMSVTPIVMDMTTTPGKAQQITVFNDGARPLPVEIIVSRIELDENGEISATPEDKDFLVFPPQKLIPAGATQNFRIQWVGDVQIPASQSYVFSVNQVPVKMPEGKSGVQVVFNFATIVNVAPPGAKAAIDLLKAGVGTDAKGKPRPALTVRNPGNCYARLTDATITLSGGSWSETLTPETLRQSMGVGLVQPGRTRRFLLPVDMPAGVTNMTANIDYKPGR